MADKTSTVSNSWNTIFISLGLILTLLWIFHIRFQPNLSEKLSSIEIVVLLFYPLIVFYWRIGLPVQKWLLYVVILTVYIVVTDPIIHESSHILGNYAIGSKIIKYQLIPKFWKGEFAHGGWVQSEPITGWLGPIPGLAPYIKDILLLTAGWIIFKKRRIHNAFLAGFMYVFFCLSPMFDIISNYSLKLIGRVEGNDFHGVALGWGEVWANGIGILFSIIALSISIWVILIFKISAKKSLSD